MKKFENNYDLEDRTLDFSKKLIKLLQKIPKNLISCPLIDQCLRSGTSVGANYREANGASSKKDFQNKIYICKKESKETLYWLELIASTANSDEIKTELRELWQENKQFILIFSKIVSSIRNKN
ncbi:four helix bundle protein [Candidatus Beckwithbacteria bacterium]|nr:four helix bundle protein [Candidatus Beckwithbacteria bacterium]